MFVTKAGRALLAAPSSSKPTHKQPTAAVKRKSLSHNSTRNQAMRAFGKRTSEVAGLTGMGVRTGPPVHGHPRSSPTKPPAHENDPFSLAFKPVLPSLSPQPDNSHSAQPRVASPIRQGDRLTFGPSPKRLLQFNDGSSPPPPSGLPSSPTGQLSPVSGKKHFVDNSSDDEFDVDSPRKKQRHTGFGFSPSHAPPTSSISQRLLTTSSLLRSPSRPSPVKSAPGPSILPPLACPRDGASTSTLGPTSVPMSRARHHYPAFDFAPPPARAMDVDSTLEQPSITVSLIADDAQSELRTENEQDDGDVSMANTTLSEDAAKKLTDLQAMLSRLSKPRHSIATSSLSTKAQQQQTPGRQTLSRTVPGAASSSSAVGRPPHPRQSLAGTTSSSATGRRALTAPTLASANKAKPTLRRSDVSLMPPPADRPSRRMSTLPSLASSVAVGPSSAAASSTAVSSDPVKTAKAQCLRGVVAYVDVRTHEGDDAGMIFVDMLKSMGARVVTRPTMTVTHIVYKAGRPGTISHYRSAPEPKPHVVGIAWVVRCAELEQRASEKPYKVETAHEPVQPKRRRTMEPKAYGQADLNKSIGEADPSMHEAIAASIERARRKSLQYAPKVASPLRKRVWTAAVAEEGIVAEEEEVEERAGPESIDAMLSKRKAEL